MFGSKGITTLLGSSGFISRRAEKTKKRNKLAGGGSGEETLLMGSWKSISQETVLSAPARDQVIVVASVNEPPVDLFLLDHSYFSRVADDRSCPSA